MQQLVAALQPQQDPKLTAEAVRKTPYSDQLRDQIQAHVAAEMAQLESLSDQRAKAAGLQQIVDLLRALNDIKDAAAQATPAPAPATSSTIAPSLQSAIKTLSDSTKTEQELLQACATLKGIGDEECEMALFKSLSNPTYKAVREAAAGALVGFISDDVFKNLFKQLGERGEPAVLAAVALRGVENPGAIRAVFQVLKNTKDARVAVTLQGIDLKDVLAALKAMLRDSSDEVRMLACIALKGNSDPKIQKEILTRGLLLSDEALRDCDSARANGFPTFDLDKLVLSAADALAAAPITKRLTKTIISLGLTRYQPLIRTASIRALTRAPKAICEPVLRWCVMNDASYAVKQEAAQVLGSVSCDQLSIQLAADKSVAVKAPQRGLWDGLLAL